jgi:hypothetical protein
MKSIHKRKDLIGRQCHAWTHKGGFMLGRIHPDGIVNISTGFVHEFSEFKSITLELKKRK